MPDAIEFTLDVSDSHFLLPLPIANQFLTWQLESIFQYAEQRFGTDDLIVSEAPRLEPGASRRYVIRRAPGGLPLDESAADQPDPDRDFGLEP